MQFDWRILDTAEKDCVVAAINPLLKEHALDLEASAARVTVLPFYSNFQFVELTDLRPRQPKSMFALHKAGADSESYVLDWTNRPIYMTNERAPIRLNQQNVVPYLGFFFACVQGPYGPMTVVEGFKPPPDAPLDVYNMADALLGFCPPKIVGRTAGGGYIVKGPMLFKDCIFMTKMEVGHNGFIKIAEHVLGLGGLTSEEQKNVKSSNIS